MIPDFSNREMDYSQERLRETREAKARGWE